MRYAPLARVEEMGVKNPDSVRALWNGSTLIVFVMERAGCLESIGLSRSET